jgi:hypothetical protein
LQYAQSKKREEIAGASHRLVQIKQTGILSPDSLSQAVPPWLADFHL